MKQTTILSALLSFFCWHVSSMDLKTAIASRLVAVDVTGSNYDSIPSSVRTGFYPEMQMTVSNLSSQPIALDLEPGYMLEAAEPGYQAMLLTQSIDMKLKPNERRKDYLYAMCTQLHNSGPNSSLHYSVGNRATPALLRMALFITSKKYLLSAAQEAVWSISDDLPVMSIGDKNPAITEDLQKEVASIKGLHMEELKKEYEKRKGDVMTEYIGNKLDRNIPFTVQDSAMVSVGFYDREGTLKRVIVKDQLMRQGKHSIRYNPYPLAFAGQRYSVRMIRDGQVFRQYYFRQ